MGTIRSQYSANQILNEIVTARKEMLQPTDTR